MIELPNRITHTEYLKSDKAMHGYRYVQMNKAGKFYCFHKGLNTGLHDTPMLAAYVLHKRATSTGISLSEDESEGIIEYYPEASYLVPGVDPKEVAYLRDPRVMSGWSGTKLRVTRGKRTFQLKRQINDLIYTTQWYNYPMAAAVAFHNQVDLRVAEAFDFKAVRATMGKPDFIRLEEMECNSSTGYFHVYRRDSRFFGRIIYNGEEHATQLYKTAEEAAWDVLHMMEAVPSVDSMVNKVERQTLELNGEDRVKQIRSAYAEIKVAAEELANRPVVKNETACITIGKTMRNGVEVVCDDF